MDDSDQDFSFLCSRLLKRVRRKGGESGDEKKTVEKDEGEDEDSGSQIPSRNKAPCKRKREKKEGLQSQSTHRIHTDGLVQPPVLHLLVGGAEQKVPMQFIIISTLYLFQLFSSPAIMSHVKMLV